MKAIPKNSRYVVRLKSETHVLAIEEVSAESNPRERRYRLHIPANHEGEGKTISSSSELDAALCGAEFLVTRAKRYADKLANRIAQDAFVQ